MQRRIIKNKFLKVALLGCLVLGSLSFVGSKDYKKSNFNHKKSSYKRSKITPARAKQIALAKVPGATLRNIKDFEFDEDSYEGEIHYRGYTYEFEIDAYTGRITDWDVDRD